MITEDYVSFELAKLLKEKGFDEEIETMITPEGKIYYVDQNSVSRACHTRINNSSINIYSEDCSCPTLQMVMKWLREIHHYYIIISPEYGDIEYQPGQWQEECLGWVYSIIKTEDGTSITTSKKFYGLNYEESCKAAIKYCLDHLIVK